MRGAATCLLLAAAAALAAPAGAAGATRARIPGGTFATILPPSATVKEATVRSFEVDRRAVTNAEFATFVAAHPAWRRDRVAGVFADTGYLQHWQGATQPGAALAAQPVTHVSWFAAREYCKAQGARLPTWYEWEYVSAANDKSPDARSDPAWRQAILDWYARPASVGLPAAGSTPPNYYGVHDVHGVVWEWVLDLGSMMVSADNREQGDPDLKRFCGTGALTMEQKENYAMLMRIAMLSSMRANYTSATMGFRCVAGPEPGP